MSGVSARAAFSDSRAASNRSISMRPTACMTLVAGSASSSRANLISWRASSASPLLRRTEPLRTRASRYSGLSSSALS